MKSLTHFPQNWDVLQICLVKLEKNQENSPWHGFPMILMNRHSVLEQTVCAGADSSRLVHSPQKKSLLFQTALLLLCFQQLLLVSVIHSCLVINICCSTAASDTNTSVRVVASFIIRTVHLVQLGSSVSEQDGMVLQPFHAWSWILNLTVKCDVKASLGSPNLKCVQKSDKCDIRC